MVLSPESVAVAVACGGDRGGGGGKVDEEAREWVGG